MKKTKKIILFILLLAVTVLTLFVPTITVSASTAETDLTKTSVIDDLGRMNLDNIQNLSSTENIFLGMSQYYDSTRNLHTYIYMNYIGSREDVLKAKISTSVSNAAGIIIEEFKEYKMTPVNSYRTWVKYEVLDLPNTDQSTRRYKFKSIKKNDISIIEVDDMYAFHGITNMQMEVFRQEIETITITDSELKFHCYGQESDWANFWGYDKYMAYGNTYSDAWYIFFNTDKPMDDILEIEITYKPFDYIYVGTRSKMTTVFDEEFMKSAASDPYFDHGEKFEPREQETVIIKPGKTKVEATKDKWYSKYDTHYEKYIDNILDLSKKEYFKDTFPFVFSKEKQKYKWGVNFTVTEKETERYVTSYLGNQVTHMKVSGTGMCNTAILRIKYEHNGLVKNAYAVDTIKNTFTGEAAEIPNDWDWKTIVKILIVIILVLLLWPIISPILKLCFEALGTVIKFVFKVLLLPITLLTNRKRKKDTVSVIEIKKE